MLRGNKVLIPDIYRNLLRPQQCRLFRSFLFRRICPLYAVHTVHTVIFARICSPFPKIRNQSELSSLNHPPFQNISSNNSSSIAAHSTPFFFFFCRQYNFVRVHCFHMSFFFTIWRQSTRGDRFSCRLLSCSDCFSCSKSSGFKKALPSPL